MADTLKIDLEAVQPIVDPTTGSGLVSLFPEALGQEGRPYILFVEDPPGKTRSRHYHHGDVLYFYTRGEHTIEGEGVYRAGDIRWTRAGHAYGPETTGPDGGAWWVISMSDPIPVETEEGEQVSAEGGKLPEIVEEILPRFGKPYDWDRIRLAMESTGVVILEGWVTDQLVGRVNQEIDEYLARGLVDGAPNSGSPGYDMFLGGNTLRLHGLAQKVPSSVELIGSDELLGLIRKLMRPIAQGVLLNAAELIEIKPGEPAQMQHRDTDSWPIALGLDGPALINVIVALDPFTIENGATTIAPRSWTWDKHRSPKKDELVSAKMDRGDAVIFRGDLIHGGGANKSPQGRRAMSISYCAGWLRPVENSLLNLSWDTIRELPTNVQDLIGFAPHDRTNQKGGLLGLYENGHPRRALRDALSD